LNAKLHRCAMLTVAAPSDGKHSGGLSPEDQIAFRVLRECVGAQKSRSQGTKRTIIFEESIRAIRNFCIRNNGCDWTRCLACGLCWPTAGEIAVNLRRLSTLLAQSKASTNRGLNQMGYVSVCPSPQEIARLRSAIPCLATETNDLRQWSIRKWLAQMRASHGAPAPEGAAARGPA
jgi:hypothetical protein